MDRNLIAYLRSALVRQTRTLAPHVAADHAPTTLAATLAEHSATGRLTVWAGASDATAWGEASANHLFRAWHVETGLGFGVDDEEAISRLQAGIAGRIGAVFAEVVELEIGGQARYYGANGNFLAEGSQLEWTVTQLRDAGLVR